jgi:hypothetical protein
MRVASRLGWVVSAGMCGLGCRGGGESPAAETTAASGGSVTASPPTTGSPTGRGTTAASGGTAPDGTITAGPATTTTTADTGGPSCAKNVVLTGYWPPTNEMLRPWSTNSAQNEGGWIGANWGGHGYDVYAFFPEFPPDGDPTNDAIGEDGSVGSPRSDLRVDYQATSADFWRIVDRWQPVILLTTSRGGDIGWEIEAVDGGHGVRNTGGPESDWAPDRNGAEVLPTEASIEPRSWAAISQYRQGKTLASSLPIAAIVAATTPLRVTDVVVDTETGGNYLSGFMGLHGLVYHSLSPHNVAAGHIHVGAALPVADAKVLIEATLHAVLQAHPAEGVACPRR